jgi:hypothetical protein
MKKASPADRDYFARLARANVLIQDEQVPQSLDEMFDRLEQIRRQLGAWARPGVQVEDDGDLDGHLRFLARQRIVLARGTIGT